ncbi:MAG TPA: DUF427 domain-containing protein [Acidimicrobiales bacterium]|nr:DUF427 domain-containing protein [Acidimicrobiales bacterium]
MGPKPQRIEPAPGQESVWDYPRPPLLEAVNRQVEVIFGGNTIAITLAPLRVLETSHPPVYYLPLGSFIAGCVAPSGRTSYCEFKGLATYLDVVVGKHRAPSAAWRYDDPSPAYAALAGCISFYPALMDVCLVDGEFVSPQPGGFYGGWITSKVVGPFKGEPGTEGW